MQVAPWSIAPFALLLLAIAILPLAAPKWWHSNWHKAIVSAAFGIPAALYLLYLEFGEGQPGLHNLAHAAEEYIDFIVMLAALYTVAGGIAIEGQFRPTPLVNVAILAIGAVLANFIGTTGASMLLIRPFLRINLIRQHRWHFSPVALVTSTVSSPVAVRRTVTPDVMNSIGKSAAYRSSRSAVSPAADTTTCAESALPISFR